MPRYLLLACCLCLAMTERARLAFCSEVPSADELRTLVVEPLRGLQFGRYKIRITDHVMGRSVTKHITFKNDCVRMDAFGLESVAQVRRSAGNTTPFVLDPATTFVVREAICGDEFVTYNPAKEVGNPGFSVSVQKLSDPAVTARVRNRFFNPRFIGLRPNLLGHLRIDSLKQFQNLCNK